MFWGSFLALEENEESRKMVTQMSVKTDMEEISIGKKKPVDSGVFKKAYVNQYF